MSAAESIKEYYSTEITNAKLLLFCNSMLFIVLLNFKFLLLFFTDSRGNQKNQRKESNFSQNESVRKKKRGDRKSEEPQGTDKHKTMLHVVSFVSAGYDKEHKQIITKSGIQE